MRKEESMFIYPTSTIVFLRGVPLDTTYEHTIYFSSESDQYNYFLSKYKPNITKADGRVVSFYLTGQTYTRVGDNIRVGICADDLYDCNYIMFRNNNYGPKWFYAFLKSVKYVNNEVSIVEYQIDVIQTWFFDYELEMTFVDREHAASDNMFEHIIEENLDIGKELKCISKMDGFLFNELSLVMMYAGLSTEGLAGRPNLLPSGYYMPCYYYFTSSDATGATEMTHFMTDGVYIQEPNDVITCYQAPGVYNRETQQLVDSSIHLEITVPANMPIDGYVPKNNKLYCSPYNQIIVSNNCGGSAIYKFEDSNNANHTLDLYREVNSMPSPSAIVYPRNYRGIDKDYDSGLVFDNFPVCGWVTDTYKAWWAQHQATYQTQEVDIINKGFQTMLNAAGKAGAQAAGGGEVSQGPAIAAAAAVMQATVDEMYLVAKQIDINALPNAAGGQFKCDTLNLKLGRLGYIVYWMTIKREHAVIIDNFFTKYGYACRKLKVPNRNARRYWTYTKTSGCVIRPVSTKGMPCDDEAKICAIYNKGITFWAYRTNEALDVGDYTKNNEPTGHIGG